eukprot:g463.t1
MFSRRVFFVLQVGRAAPAPFVAGQSAVSPGCTSGPEPEAKLCRALTRNADTLLKESSWSRMCSARKQSQASQNAGGKDIKENQAKILVMIKAAGILRHRVVSSLNTWASGGGLRVVVSTDAPLRLDQGLDRGLKTPQPHDEAPEVAVEEFVSPPPPNGTALLVRRHCQTNSLCTRYQEGCYSHVWNFLRSIHDKFHGKKGLDHNFDWLVVVDDDTYVFEAGVRRILGTLLAAPRRKWWYGGSLAGTRTESRVASTAAGAFFSHALAVKIYQDFVAEDFLRQDLDGEVGPDAGGVGQNFSLDLATQRKIVDVCKDSGQGDDMAMGALAFQYVNLTGVPGFYRNPAVVYEKYGAGVDGIGGDSPGSSTHHLQKAFVEQMLLAGGEAHHDFSASGNSLDAEVGHSIATAHCNLRTKTINQYWRETPKLMDNCWQNWRTIQEAFYGGNFTVCGVEGMPRTSRKK